MAAYWASTSSINRWPCSRLQLFSSRPSLKYGSGTPGVGNMVHGEEVGSGCWYARITGGRWNGSWKDFYLSCSSNDFQIGDWESCNGVATVHFMGEYPWRVFNFGLEGLSWYCWWRTGVLSAPAIEFCILLSVGDSDNSTSQVSSTWMSPRTYPGHYNAQSGRNFQHCHQQNDAGNKFQSGQLVACRKWESHPQEFEHQYCSARNQLEYPTCVVWYLNIQIETIKQWPTFLLCKEFCDFDESHRYKTKNSMSRQIAMNAKLHSNYKSQIHRDCTHSKNGVIRQSGWFQECMTFQRIILWCNCMVLRHCILLWRVWCMLTRPNTKKHKTIWRTRGYRLQSLG